MKYITFTVPCYNSEEYLAKCVESLLPGGEDVEIILVNDGSTDGTAAIIDHYAAKYPNIVVPVHKENGGHGSGVNAGMERATGAYFKVIDSDDWADADAYAKLLAQVKSHVDNESETSPAPDLYICNYVYNKVDEGSTQTISYKNVFPTDTMCTFEDSKPFMPSQYLIMHSQFFKTSILRQSGLRLPDHTFYADNLFAYHPLPYVKNIFYMDIDFYQYYIGREGQSVTQENIIKRIDQYIKVAHMMIDSVDVSALKETSPKMAKYMNHFMSMVVIVVSMHLLMDDTDESREKKNKFWADIKEKDHALYNYLSYNNISGLLRFETKAGDKLYLQIYKTLNKIYKFQ